MSIGDSYGRKFTIMVAIVDSSGLRMALQVVLGARVLLLFFPAAAPTFIQSYHSPALLQLHTDQGESYTLCPSLDPPPASVH